MPLRQTLTQALPSALFLLGTLTSPGHAGWPNDPAVNVPVSTRSSIEYASECVSDRAGGVIVTWYDYRSGIRNLYAQRIGPSGRPLWAPGGVAVCTDASGQYEACATADGFGGVVVAWVDDRGGTDDIYAQRLDASGTTLWTSNGVAVCAASGTQTVISIVPDGTGGAILAWQDNRNGNYDVYARRVNAVGSPQWTANGVVICTAADNQFLSGMVADGAGGAIVAWSDYRSGGQLDLYTQKVSAAGSVAWTANGKAVCTAAGAQSTIRLATDGAGGAIAAWQDYRSGTSWDIYVQRIGSDGSMPWTADGVWLPISSGDQTGLAVAEDGSGGIIFAWEDERSGERDLFAFRLNRNGAAQWSPLDGVVVCTAPGVQQNLRMLPDGAGGVIMTWQDQRAGSAVPRLYAQRLNGSGSAYWASNGVPVCTALGTRTWLRGASDGAGGIIGAWSDDRDGENDVFAQRVDQWGQLGAQPTIASVADVRDDQGGQVKVSWYASPLDSFPTYSIGNYYVYRSVPAGLAMRVVRDGVQAYSADDTERPATSGTLLARVSGTATEFWELVGSVTARRLSGYSYLAPTESDSLPGSCPMTRFMIEARSSSGTQWWFSDPDSGYSVDDLAPAAPAPFTGQYANGSTLLAWGASNAPDCAGYRLYRGDGPGFVPGAGSLVAMLTSNVYVDAPGGPYWYKLTAVDVHGNESPATTLLPSGTADVEPSASRLVFALERPAPHPVRGGGAVIRFAVPHSARGSLALFDSQGRRVRTLLEGVIEAGEHQHHFEPVDAAGVRLTAGLYFLRLQVGDRARVQRVALID